MSKTINLGPVTAYADAVAAGYTGTREQFAQDLANAANYAAESHANAEAASDAAETATAAASAASLDADAAHDDAATAHSDAEAALSFKTAAETAATTATTKAGEAANSASQAATSASGAAGSATAASGSATAAAGSATNAAASETAAAGSATAAAGSASAAAQTLVDVNAAGATQIAAIGAKGEEVLESIPSDYTTLSNDVDELKSDLINSHIYTDNYFDLAFVQGNINPSSGANAGSSQKIRTDVYYSVTENITVTFNKLTYPQTIFLSIYRYNENNELINTQSFTQEGTFTFDIQNAAALRFLIGTASADSETIISPSDGASMLQVFERGVLDLLPDTTLTLPNRSADAKSVSDRLKSICTEKIVMDWERGSISTSSGSNISSSATNRIRTGYKYQINTTKFHVSIPYGMKVAIYVYTAIYGLNYDRYLGAFAGEVDIDIESGKLIRLAALNTDDSDLPITAGNSVIVSYNTDIQAFLDKYNTNTLTGYSCLSMFETMGVIGDSWASGSIHTPNGYVDTVYAMSWGQILARKAGIAATNYSKGGLSSKTWLSDTSYGLSALLADNPKNLYIINLGINDNTQIVAGTLTLGTIEDVDVSDYTQNPDTFFGNYGRIIGNIKSHAPKAIIITVSVLRPNERNMDAYIKQIAEKYGVPFIQVTDDAYFTSGYFYRSIYNGHMSAFGYSGIANAIQRLMQKYIIDNPIMFAYYDGLAT